MQTALAPTGQPTLRLCVLDEPVDRALVVSRDRLPAETAAALSPLRRRLQAARHDWVEVASAVYRHRDGADPGSA